jgi:hypothetical protein
MGLLIGDFGGELSREVGNWVLGGVMLICPGFRKFADSTKLYEPERKGFGGDERRYR